MPINYDDEVSENSDAIDLHFNDKGHPVISFRGVVIKAFSGISVKCDVEEINTAEIRCAINLRPDASHIKEV